MCVPVARALSIKSLSSLSPGCGVRSASPPVFSRRTPSSRRVSLSASRAVEAIASRRPPASDESCGEVSRAAALSTSRRRSPTDDAPRCHVALGRCGPALPSRSVRECSPPSLPGRVERGDGQPTLTHRLADDESGHEEKQRKSTREAGLATIEPRRCKNDERNEQRASKEETAADHELGEQEEHDAEARYRQLSAMRGNDRDGNQSGCHCSGKRPSSRDDQRPDRKHVQSDYRARGGSLRGSRQARLTAHARDAADRWALYRPAYGADPRSPKATKRCGGTVVLSALSFLAQPAVD
jgi:hypothetical protein